MGPAWWTSRKKWTMFSGRVSSGMCPRITMRSKQWYTKASRLPNSLTNDSIGPPRRRSCLDNKIIEQRAGGIKEPRHVHAGPRLFKSSRGSKFQIYLGRDRLSRRRLDGSGGHSRGRRDRRIGEGKLLDTLACCCMRGDGG